MAPKAKAGAKAKALLSRPAGVPRGAPVRGGRRVRGRGGLPAAAEAEDPKKDWKDGKEVELKGLSLLDFATGQHIVVTEGVYYGNKVKLAGKLVRLEMEAGAAHLYLLLTGTTSEGLLQAHSSDPKTLVMVHLCNHDCSQLESGDHYVHGLKARLASGGPGVEEGWVTNLEEAPRGEGVDELAALRARGREVGRKDKPPRKDEVEELDRSEESEEKANKDKKKKKKKEDKKEKVEKKKHDGRQPVKSSVKSPEVLFAGTGLDPRERVRKRVMRKAKKFLNKRRKKERSDSTSEGSSSQSSSEDESLDAGGLFSETGKAKSLAKNFPGVLTYQAVQQMQEQLLTEVGETSDNLSTRPISLLYFRQELARKARSDGEGTTQSHLLSRRSPERQSGCGHRHSGTESEGLRGRPERHPLDDSPTNGSCWQRIQWNSSGHRAGLSRERELRGQQNSLPGNPGAGKRTKGKRKEGRPKRREEPRWRRLDGEGCRQERKREEERIPVRSDGAVDDMAEADSGFKGEVSPKGFGGDGLESGVQVQQDSQPLYHSVFPDRGLFDPLCQVDRPLMDEVSAVSPSADAGISRLSEKISFSDEGLVGMRFCDLGAKVLQCLLEVFPLRSKTTGCVDSHSLFPLPTSRMVLSELYPHICVNEMNWLIAVCLGLNSYWGGDLFSENKPSGAQCSCLDLLLVDVQRLCEFQIKFEQFDWDVFFSHRSVDYHGDEVKVARWFKWCNVAPALPAEVGKVPLNELCTRGARHYVDHFELYLKPRHMWPSVKSPRVMVADEDWGEVCTGLVKAGVCTFMAKDDLFQGPNGPLLNGMFGVTKDEWSNGVEVYRLIMNLIPLNSLCQSISGDVQSLPSWSLMNPFFIQPGEQLLISSEDVRCFFYVMAVPVGWWKFLGFNKPVPQSEVPPEFKGRETFLVSKVLPMGFLNSVSLAQHVHRNVVLHSQGPDGSFNRPESEIRKDKAPTLANPAWRVYLDNYDLLERVEASQVASRQGTTSPQVLALREQYEVWGVPRNLKKSVERGLVAEVQGACVDGSRGIAFPREVKLLKYVSAAMTIVNQQKVSQRQMQVICGGLVYVSMFRRPLLGTLNAVWRFIEGFSGGQGLKPLPPECKVEILRFVALVPLARMDFRMTMHGQVTCSDASTLGGGICASKGLSPFGVLATHGGLRGEMAENREDHRILSVGLFDGVGALRVALDLVEAEVVGHVSVECNGSASRVAEGHFPGSVIVPDVNAVDEAMVREWSCNYSQVSLVLLGAGPPCQGVSGLNADRKGALRDERSGLFVHVKRVETLLKQAFPWCQVHTLMESVASMDQQDLETMSDDFGSYPWKCDAGHMLWCNRPRFYWITWDLYLEEGVQLSSGESSPGSVVLTGHQHLDLVTKEGWMKVTPEQPYPTFTTSRPRSNPGRKPAGVQQCSEVELRRWEDDQHRFPPYQYMNKHCLINRMGRFRVPSVEERELMLGFPLGYTSNCLPKNQRKSQVFEDTRLTLLGNTWAVPVVAWFLQQLLSPRGFCRSFTPQALLDKLQPENNPMLQSRLLRLPTRPLRASGASSGGSFLARQLGNLTSMKGEDILLQGPSSDQVKFHRLRASIPSKLWRWKIIAGWRWSNSKEHINCLEMRAILATLKWRIAHQGLVHQRFIHLTDSLVCLHALTRGRSSSRKLRRTISRINALLLASSCQGVWSYVHTDQNPADKPSRWGQRVKTKFRNG